MSVADLGMLWFPPVSRHWPDAWPALCLQEQEIRASTTCAPLHGVPKTRLGRCESGTGLCGQWGRTTGSTVRGGVSPMVLAISETAATCRRKAYVRVPETFVASLRPKPWAADSLSSLSAEESHDWTALRSISSVIDAAHCRTLSRKTALDSFS